MPHPGGLISLSVLAISNDQISFIIADDDSNLCCISLFACSYTYQAMVEPSTQEEMEIHERAMKHVREMGEERKRSSLKRRLMMRLRKDGYDASLCRSSWVATTEHPGGNKS